MDIGLIVKDKTTGDCHVYGTDTHDSLYINNAGNICYYNLENGEGSGEDDEHGYELLSIREAAYPQLQN